MSKQAGFTLIELVVVIVVLGILAAVAIPRYVDLTDEAREAVRDGAIGALYSAAALYIADNSGNIPGTAAIVTATLTGGGVTVAAGTANCLFTITVGTTVYADAGSLVGTSLCSGA